MTRPPARDIVRYATLRCMGAIARLLPPLVYRGMARTAAVLPAWPKASAQRQKARALFPKGFSDATPVAGLPRRVMAHRLEEMMFISRLGRNPDWRPALHVEGLDALRAAQRDCGIMMWCCPQRFNMLLTSLCLHDAGLDPVRLSHWTHGPAATDHPSDFAQARMNRPWQAVENRYARRLEIGPGSLRKPMAAYAQHLREGGLVMVNAVPLAVNPVAITVPNGVFHLASGAARAARMAGARIWTSVLRRAPDGAFHLRLAPLSDTSAPTDLDSVLTLMAHRSHAAIAADPSLWVVASPQLEPEVAA